MKKRNNSVGRPHKEIDRDYFEKLCGLQCSLLEIAEYFGVDKSTVEAWCKREYSANFSEVFKQKRTKGFISLRHKQFQLAETSVPMAIFLGKNYLGQSDRQNVELIGSKESPVNINHSYDLEMLTEQELLTLRGILTKAEHQNAVADGS